MSFSWKVLVEHWPVFWKGFWSTVAICALSLCIGLVTGTVLGVLRVSSRRWIRRPALWFVEVIRGTPFLIQVYLVYYVLPSFGIRLTAFQTGLLTLSIYATAYIAEIVRGGIQSVPYGQVEAARSLGMPYVMTMRRIVIPQIWSVVLPPLTGQFIGLIKESSLLSIITVPELTFAAQEVMGYVFRPVEAYAAITVLYWVVNESLARVAAVSERVLSARR